MARYGKKTQKHKDYILAQWPDDLATNTDYLATPYPCHACGKPCKSVQTLRTHDCKKFRERSIV